MCGIQMSLHAEFRGAQYERVGQISAFRSEVDENCLLLVHQAGSSGNLYRRFGTTYTSVREFNNAVPL